MILLSDYDYDLPKELIAQTPSEKRDLSRLMVVNRSSHSMNLDNFRNILDYFCPGDLLVFNDTKVIPARLFGKRNSTGGKVEVFLLEQKESLLWEVLVKPARRIKFGETIVFDSGLTGEVIEELDQGRRLIKFTVSNADFYEIIDSIGHIPLPPYIKYDHDNKELYKTRYQTVFAEKSGAVAAPTAGLHFSQDLINGLKAQGINFAGVTLAVGLGTFRPIEVNDVKNHKMHAERYIISADTVDFIKKTKTRGRRVFAIGTTATRVLEGVFQKYGQLKEDKGMVDIFIYPGYSFQVIDGLITNFHLPKSSLLLMISSLVGKDLLFQAYNRAIQEKFRFFSFGDAMLIV